MLVVSIVAFFILTFLLIAIVVGVAWMGILKSAREEAEAARRDQETSGEAGPAVEAYPESTIFREEKLSTIAILDRLLTRFDFMELLRERIAQADLNWPVGRAMSGMRAPGSGMCPHLE